MNNSVFGFQFSNFQIFQSFVDLGMDKKPSLNKTPIIIYLSIAIILVVSYFSFPEFKQGIDEAFDVITGEDEERLQTWVSKFGMFGPVAIILGMMVQMFLIVVPNFLLMMIAIVSYGPVWGSVISFIGVFAASSLGYYIGSKLSRVTLKKFVSTSNQDKVGEFIKDYGIATVVICRLCSFSNDAISFVAGMLKMNYRKYILSSLTGVTPLIVLLAIFGKNEKIEWALLWIAGVSLVILVVYIIVDRRRKRLKMKMKS
jgi:uncharacterized membrane protein YdjX (TVP38/TMEM64 family)